MVIASANTQIIDTGKATTAEALELFDSLEPVNLDFMWGRWRGKGIDTDHPMDGMLEMSNWYGKEFVDAETVHPLLFADGHGEIFKVAPLATAMDMVLKLPMPNNPSFKPLLIALTSLFKTDKSQARLRMLKNRGKVTATMIYDYLPINDSFRKLDENRVFGIMDFKKIQQPFFFVLTRDEKA